MKEDCRVLLNGGDGFGVGVYKAIWGMFKGGLMRCSAVQCR